MARTRARKNGKASRARRADRYALYEQAVQDPDYDLALAQRIYRQYYGRTPRFLREDFCGTAIFACRWVQKHRENRAWGIDIDPAPLAYARDHHLAALRPQESERVVLLQDDVRTATHEKVDVTVAYNFSYLIFDTRDALRGYFEKVRSTLRRQGLFLLDLYGGADAMRVMTETREHDDFDYVWDQSCFDPIHNRAVNYIHFEFPDGSALRRAFRYQWRLWSLPELRELLHESGFSDVGVYWEGTDRKTNEGNGVYRRVKSAPADPAWVSYLSAVP